MEECRFDKIQIAALNLMRNDLRLMTTVFLSSYNTDDNRICSFLPYMGLIVDGIEDWTVRYNRSSDSKLELPTFNAEEQQYYEQIRAGIKIWASYDSAFHKLEQRYNESKDYFLTICNPINRLLGRYRIWGCDLLNDSYCGNTVLYSCFIPRYIYGDGEEKGKQIESLSQIAGGYAALFSAAEEYETNSSVKMHTRDYGGNAPSPIGNGFGDKFVLFSMLGQINYVIQFIDHFIVEESTAKLRFAYLLYYYIGRIIPEINKKLTTSFSIDETWSDDRFRSAMAHYGLGMTLKTEADIIEEDPLYGLAQKLLKTDYFSLKNAVFHELSSFANQLESYLKIGRGTQRGSN